MNAYSFMRHGLVLPAIGLACLVTQTALAETVSGSSGPTFVDSTSPSARFCRGTATLAYSPQYADKTAADTAYVIISKVDTLNAVTSQVVKCAAGEGSYVYEPATDADKRVRLLLNAFDAEDTAIGEMLVSDLVLPIALGTAAASVRVDTRAGSLQEVAEAEGTAPFAYDTAWATNGTPATLEIECECVRRTKSGTLVSVRTNTVFEAAAPAVGDYLLAISKTYGGNYTFKCLIKDSDDQLLGPEMTATYSLPYKVGCTIIFR